MISLEQMADIDATIVLAVHTYPGCRFLCVDLEYVSVEDADGDLHIMDSDASFTLKEQEATQCELS